MYKCTKCYEMFAEPDSKTICYEDYYGVGSLFDTRNYTDLLICPECGDEDIEYVGELTQCASCGEWFDEDDLYIVDKVNVVNGIKYDCKVNLCEECYEEWEE